MPFFNKDPEAEYDGIQIFEPIIETPFTRVSAHWMTWQKGPCAQYEYDWSRCAARVGGKEASKVCRELFEDFHECIYRAKANARYNAMQAERKKQGKDFLEAPPKDSIRTWHKKDN